MIFRGGRKRLKVSSSLSADESSEEVGEFDVNSSSDSDFENSQPRSLQSKLLKRNPATTGDGGAYGAAETWVERYSHISAQTGLVASTRKAKEILSWLRAAIDDCGPRFLVLAGPPGCGKASAVRAAALDTKCEVACWQAPATGQRGISVTLLEDFHSFVVGGRYPTLQMEDEDGSETDTIAGGKLLLVEDMPVNVSDYLHKRIELRETLRGAAAFAPHPTVVLISESEKSVSRTVRLLLGSELMESARVTTIMIPRVTDAMMKKRLREILGLEGFSISRRQLESIVASSCGDIRAALNAVQFCVGSELKTDFCKQHGLKEISKRGTKRPRRKQTSNFAAIAALGQDAVLGTYHAVSKILNNKKREDGSSKYNVETMLEDARADPASFSAFLHQNYPDFFRGTDDAVAALECLSDADCLLSWRQDDLARTALNDCAASVITRGFLLFNSNPVRTGWRPIRGPESFEVAKAGRAHAETALRHFNDPLGVCVQTRSTMCETVPFAQQIMNSTIRSLNFGDGSDVPVYPRTNNLEDVTSPNVKKANEGLNGRHKYCSNVGLAPPLNPEVHDGMEPIEDWDD